MRCEPRGAVAVVVALVLWAGRAGAQTADSVSGVTSWTSTILRVSGRTIEIVGLHRWTPAMIQDSMNVHAPGDSLASSACAAVLRYDLKFAEAASLVRRLPHDTTAYFLVAVIEPQDSALVRHRPMPLDTTASRARWRPIVELARRNKDLLDRAVRARIAARGAGRDSAIPGSVDAVADSAAMREVWAYLDEHEGPADAAAARALLRKAPNLYDRLAALAILSSFDRDDATWWALAATLREIEGVPRLYAGTMLGAFARAAPRRVNWGPALEDLHAVLNGTNLWVLDQVLEALTLTGADSSLARPLLNGGGHAVLMYAGAAHPAFREPAQRFLRAVSGRDYGNDLAAWEAWIGGL